MNTMKVAQFQQRVNQIAPPGRTGPLFDKPVYIEVDIPAGAEGIFRFEVAGLSVTTDEEAVVIEAGAPEEI